MKSLIASLFIQFSCLYLFPQFVADSLWQIAIINDEYPCYSPDGNKIAFMSDRYDDNFEIYVMDSDGKNIRRLTHHQGLDETPVWSPDGSTIAFASNREGKLDIFLIDPDGNNLRQLTSSNGNDDHPKFSPNGSHIIFNSDRDQHEPPTDYEIYQINIATGNENRLTDHGKWDSYPSYSPDNKKILWRRVLDDPRSAGNWNSEIFIMDIDGSNIINLTDHPAFDGYPEWSPDGTHIAFVSNRQGSERLYLMKSDGSEVVALTGNDEGIEDVRPSFHPNGGNLIFNRVTNRGTHILNVDLKTVTDPILFQEVTESMNLEHLGSSRGAAWGDFDDDGYPELLAVNTMNQTDLWYHNRAGDTLARITEGSVVEAGGWSEGAQWVDIDNDHDLDLFVATQWGDPSLLYENTTEGMQKAEAGDLTELPSSATGSCWCDFDNDGDLDVYVLERDGADDRLFENQGEGAFELVNDFPYGGGDGRACIWLDTDGDGDQDLVVANYVDKSTGSMVKHRDFYYRNQGNGRFQEIIEGTLVTEPTASYGLSVVDFDEDGDPDLLVTNVSWSDMNRLFLNDGQGNFPQWISFQDTGAPSKGQTWGDFDNDGDLDLYIANGTEGVEPEQLQNLLYINEGDGKMHPVKHGIAVTEPEISAGTATADYDRDGDLDLYVCNWGSNQEHNSLYQNTTYGKSWLMLKLKGTQSNAMGIGAKVRLKANIYGQTKWQTRWMINNTGYGSQNEPLLHFGLGNQGEILELEIQWPSGAIDRYQEITPNQHLVATEADGLAPMKITVKPTP